MVPKEKIKKKGLLCRRRRQKLRKVMLMTSIRARTMGFSASKILYLDLHVMKRDALCIII